MRRLASKPPPYDLQRRQSASRWVHGASPRGHLGAIDPCKSGSGKQALEEAQVQHEVEVAVPPEASMVPQAQPLVAAAEAPHRC